VELSGVGIVTVGMVRVTLQTRDRMVRSVQLILALQKSGLATQFVGGNGDLNHAQANGKTC